MTPPSIIPLWHADVGLVLGLWYQRESKNRYVNRKDYHGKVCLNIQEASQLLSRASASAPLRLHRKPKQAHFLHSLHEVAPVVRSISTSKKISPNTD
jgi:hypothetical protein